MLRGFARADKNHRDVRAVPAPRVCVVIDVHLAQRGAEFAEHRLDQLLCFFAEMATRTRVQRDLPSAASSESSVFRAVIHGFASSSGRAASFRRSEEHTSELQSHRDLHSFPTRRSSDLASSSMFTSRSVALNSLSIGSINSFASSQRWQPGRVYSVISRAPHLASRASSGLSFTVLHPRVVAQHLFEDRKSTRLNSSHTEIYTLSLHDALPILRRHRCSPRAAWR